MVYKVAVNWNNVAGLTTLTPQPASNGIQYPVRSVAVSGQVTDTGAPYQDLIYTALDDEEYVDLLTVMGLLTTSSVKVTVSVLQQDRETLTSMNGWISRPQNPQYKDGFWRDLTFRVSRLRGVS